MLATHLITAGRTYPEIELMLTAHETDALIADTLFLISTLVLAAVVIVPRVYAEIKSIWPKGSHWK